jgi:LacI family transcriptional regulator
MAVAAEDYAHAHGYRLVVYNTHDDTRRETAYFNAASEGAVDGVLFSSAADQNEGLAILHSANIPAVAIDRVPVPYSGPCVMVDNTLAMRLATEHLLGLGHTRIAYINGPQRLRMTRERDQGFWQAVQAHGIPAADVRVEGTDNWDLQSGCDAMRRILMDTPHVTAVLVSADVLAIGAMRAAHAAGLRVPDDISIVGMDDIDIAAFQNPPLTTVRQFITELATLGVRLLLDILNGNEIEKTERVLRPELVVRQSSGPPRRA